MKKHVLLRRFTVSSLLAFMIMGSILGYVISNHFKDMMLDSIKDSTISFFKVAIQPAILPTELKQPINPQKAPELDKSIDRLKDLIGATQLRIWNKSSQLIYTFNSSANEPPNPGYLSAALSNIPQITVANGDNRTPDTADLTGKVINVYAPVVWRGQVVGAYEVDESYQQVAEHLAEINQQLVLIMFAGLLILYIFLWKTISNASRTLIEQNTSLFKREKELQESYARLDTTYKSTVATLSKAIDARDSYTAGHSERVTILSVAIGKELGLSSDELAILEVAALFHDVGKLGIPDNILNKPGKLTEAEYSKIKEHPVIGVNILRNIDFLQPALDIIQHHHERFSGHGYPDGIQGMDIPLGARIIAVADTYDAITSDRPYRKGLSHLEAVEELQKFKGKQFDPVIVEAFLQIDPALLA